MALSNEELHNIFKDGYFAWHRSGEPATGKRLDTKAGLQAVARAVAKDCAEIAENAPLILDDIGFEAVVIADAIRTAYEVTPEK